MKIGNINFGILDPAFIVAELSANHLQNYELAVKTINVMKESGADAVKLQTYTADTMTINSPQKYFKVKGGTIWDGQTLFDLYKKAYTSWDWHPKLKKIAEDLGLIFFSTPFDKTAVDFLENLNVLAYKISSFEITDIPLIKYIASKEKPIILSTGIADVEDIEEAIRACEEVGNDQIIILKCTSSYPTSFDEVNLNSIPFLAQKFHKIIGLSDHTLGVSVPIAAVTLGAKVVEKHFILDRKLGGPDAVFSMEPEEFQKMVKSIREVEKALGESKYRVIESMRKSRVFARSLFAVEDIKKGDIFTEKNIRSIRPGYGLHPRYLADILGGYAKVDISRGTPLHWSMISKF